MFLRMFVSCAVWGGVQPWQEEENRLTLVIKWFIRTVKVISPVIFVLQRRKRKNLLLNSYIIQCAIWWNWCHHLSSLKTECSSFVVIFWTELVALIGRVRMLLVLQLRSPSFTHAKTWTHALMHKLLHHCMHKEVKSYVIKETERRNSTQERCSCTVELYAQSLCSKVCVLMTGAVLKVTPRVFHPEKQWTIVDLILAISLFFGDLSLLEGVKSKTISRRRGRGLAVTDNSMLPPCVGLAVTLERGEKKSSALGLTAWVNIYHWILNWKGCRGGLDIIHLYW